MKKYTFLIDGVSVAIYPVLTSEEIGREALIRYGDEEISVALLSDEHSDFRIVCYDKKYNTPREPQIPLAALSCFLMRVRGYPEMRLDIACDDKTYKLSLDKQNGYNFSVKDEKCKILCTKNVEFDDGISIDAYVIDRLGGCALVLCEDADLFDKGRAEIFFDRLKQDGISSLVIASNSDRLRIRALGYITSYEAMRIALCALSLIGVLLPLGRYTADVNRQTLEFSKLASGIVFYPEIQYVIK